jgi:hypothetical protein
MFSMITWSEAPWFSSPSAIADRRPIETEEVKVSGWVTGELEVRATPIVYLIWISKKIWVREERGCSVTKLASPFLAYL